MTWDQDPTINLGHMLTNSVISILNVCKMQSNHFTHTADCTGADKDMENFSSGTDKNTEPQIKISMNN